MSVGTMVINEGLIDKSIRILCKRGKDNTYILQS